MGVKILAWVSFGAALVGGPLIAAMFIGGAIEKVLEAIPWPWIPPVILAILFIIFVRDMVTDWEPNHKAIYSLLLMPSVATATLGNLGERIDRWSSSALDLVADPLRAELGTGSPIAMALVVAALAILLAQRAIKRGATSPVGV
jgi:hypothetical protein